MEITRENIETVDKLFGAWIKSMDPDYTQKLIAEFQAYYEDLGLEPPRKDSIYASMFIGFVAGRDSFMNLFERMAAGDIVEADE